MSSAVLNSPSVERVRHALSRAGLTRLTYDELVRITQGAESELA